MTMQTKNEATADAVPLIQGLLASFGEDANGIPLDAVPAPATITPLEAKIILKYWAKQIAECQRHADAGGCSSWMHRERAVAAARLKDLCERGLLVPDQIRDACEIYRKKELRGPEPKVTGLVSLPPPSGELGIVASRAAEVESDWHEPFSILLSYKGEEPYLNDRDGTNFIEGSLDDVFVVSIGGYSASGSDWWLVQLFLENYFREFAIEIVGRAMRGPNSSGVYVESTAVRAKDQDWLEDLVFLAEKHAGRNCCIISAPSFHTPVHVVEPAVAGLTAWLGSGSSNRRDAMVFIFREMDKLARPKWWQRVDDPPSADALAHRLWSCKVGLGPQLIHELTKRARQVQPAHPRITTIGAAMQWVHQHLTCNRGW